ncbi:MAG: UDP-N-acetylmuramoyl-L-alanyl-D-glutamate--2,6-diaminopimelate ligase [Magnetococcales bacterium]|nr:UDP-N-acetylmuramoyl-L-alanyl-D-glutamate--2,6-diaminopimelate ligase [Magnetococcales bacterium]
MNDGNRRVVPLAELVASCPGAELVGEGSARVSGLHADSREIRPGWLFAALQGVRTTGSRFIEDALSRGATALLVSPDTPLPPGATPLSRIVHPRPRWALAHLAAAYFGHPARSLRLFGITGTNGKTTTTVLLATLLEALGERPGLLGTTGIFFAGHSLPATHTTPDPVALQEIFYRMVRAGCTAVVMEVSSHALDQERVAGLDFSGSVFTNLTQDHLDYHGTEEAYFAAKARLFSEHTRELAALWGEDAHAARLAALLPPEVRVLTFGQGEGWTVSAREIHRSWAGNRFRLVAEGASVPVVLPLCGDFNVSNALAAASMAHGLKLPLSEIAAALAHVQAPPGRFERLDAGQPFAVVVDYAHTPDALERLLRTARPLTSGRLICLFGCGGDRDRGKRPLMGAAVQALADRVILTDDNPRNEDPAAIRAAIRAGMRKDDIIEIPNRRQAIRRAIALAQPGDAVLIAGKGHETVQIDARGCHPFSDRTEALLALGELSSR